MRWLGPEKRPHIVKLYKFEDPQKSLDLADLFRRLNVILRVLGSWKKKIKVEEFEKYVRDTHVILHEVFPELWDNGMYSLNHRLRTPNEAFFIKIPNFWAWTDKLGK